MTTETGRAVAFGEALIDTCPDHRVIGGAPLHVSAHLVARGRLTSLVTRLGDDEDGTRIRALLEQQGVDTSLVEVDGELATGEVTITFEGKEHSFLIHGPVAWDAISGPDELPAHDIFWYGSLAARDPRSRASLERLLESSGAPIRVFDVQFRPPEISAEVLGMGLRAATVVKANEEEFTVAAETVGFPPEPAAYFKAGDDIKWLCITKGERGAELHSRSGERWSVDGAKVEVVDTVGAGDAFTAGLVDALAAGESEERALRVATEAVASTLSRSGGLPPPPS